VAGVKHQHYLYWFATDPAFTEAFARAERLCTHLIEDEILRRGLEGIDKPVFWQGQQVATVKDYDTTLLIFAAKGAMPEKYRDHVNNTHDVSPALAALMAQWQALREQPIPARQALPEASYDADATDAAVVPLQDVCTPGRTRRADVFKMLDALNQHDIEGDMDDDG
jgi:hypothetical protein